MRKQKFIVAIEETVVSEYEVEADDENEALIRAEKMYQKGLFVSEPGEVQFCQAAVISPLKEKTDWVEI